ncbi:MAG: Bile acid transporter [Mitsuokella multacida]|jgi:bile acid:Na+ symporter, BASS family
MKSIDILFLELYHCKQSTKEIHQSKGDGLMKFLEKLSAFISKYMAVFVILVAVIALFQPWTFKWAAPQIAILLGIVMFGMGTTLRLRDFRLVFQRPKDVLVGALAQFTIMPGLAWLLAKGFGLPPELAAGVILVGTCPGGTSSNVMTYLARGDVALSVSMTMTTTILAPIVTPLLTWWLAGAWVDISLSAMMMSIVKVVIVPIVGGIIVNTLFGNFVQKCVKLLPLISVVAIVLIVGGVVSVSSQRIMETGALIMLVVMLHNLLGYALGFGIAKALRMDIAKVKAISIEVGMQNSGLATSLAMMHFGAAAAIPGAIFSVWHNISGSLAANYLASRMTKEKEKEPAAEA